MQRNAEVGRFTKSSRISAESGRSLNGLSHPVWERTGKAIRGAPRLTGQIAFPPLMWFMMRNEADLHAP
jgi:hypothetical protein